METISTSVEILLSTYNGALFIEELLESLCRQTYKNFTVLTRDDGSIDDTVSRIDAFGNRLSISRIDRVPDRNIGALRSFERLLNQSSAEIVMPCDQDDIWNDNKIERSLYWYLHKKKQVENDTPVLCFSDLSLIDDKGNPLGNSFQKMLGTNINSIYDPYYLTFRNPAPGCSMVINRQLFSSTLPFDKNAIMHDWWIIIDASLRGSICYINEQLVRYRIHSSNALGIKEDRSLPPLLSVISLFNPFKLFSVISKITKNIRQGKTVFRKNGRSFSVFIYWFKLITGRYFMPSIVRMVKRGKRFSWKPT